MQLYNKFNLNLK